MRLRLHQSVLSCFFSVAAFGPFALALTACDDPDAKSDDDDDEEGGDETDSPGGAEESGGGAVQSSSASNGDPPGGIGFIDMPDGGTGERECSIWDQDCPTGEKCMPYANDGGAAWNSTRCSAVDPTPATIGDVCAVEGDGVSGIDNCEIGSMCWDVDGETNQGTCIAFCTGTEASADCADPGAECSIANDGVLVLCLPSCDPVLQDCATGQACYGIDDAFVCAPDASGPDLGQFADPCEFINACDPGLGCFNGAGVPGCVGAAGCCSTFCDITDPTATENCPGAAGGQECIPIFEEGQAPAGYENVGLCFLPAM